MPNKQEQINQDDFATLASEINAADHAEMPLVPYVEILRSEFLRRKEKNPLYSIRAFAKHLEIHVSALSRILNQKQMLSVRAGVSVIQKMEVSEEDKRTFLLSLAAQRVGQTIEALSEPLEGPLRVSSQGPTDAFVLA